MGSYKYGSGNAGNRTSKITEAETITYLNDINSSLTQVLAEIVFSIIIGGIIGALTSILIVYFIELAILAAALNGIIALSDSIESFSNGDNYQGWGYAALSILSFSGAKKLFGIYESGGNVPVTRWCRPGFKPGDWVMNREKTLKNYILSFKWDFISPTNKVASFKSGQTYPVPVTSIQWPKWTNLFDGPWKIMFGQWQYFPETQSYDYSIMSFIYYKLFAPDDED